MEGAAREATVIGDLARRREGRRGVGESAIGNWQSAIAERVSGSSAIAYSLLPAFRFLITTTTLVPTLGVRLVLAR